MEKIILDTNFLLIPKIFNVDIFGEIERICNFKYNLVVLSKTLDELKSIKENQKGKHKEAAKIALSLLKHYNIKILKPKIKGYVDDQIVKLCEKKGFIVATQDKGLKDRLRLLKEPIITLRKKKHLILLGKDI